MLQASNSVLALIDVQERLAQVMDHREELFLNLQKMVKGAKALEVPVLWLEQNPGRMGQTIPDLRELLAGQTPIPKMSFSCCGEPLFVENLETLARRQVLLAGIEAHVCVYQTAADLIHRGFEVQVVADAVSSRRPVDLSIGLERCRAAGATVTCVEMALFELMRTARHPAFKEVLKIVR